MYVRVYVLQTNFNSIHWNKILLKLDFYSLRKGMNPFLSLSRLDSLATNLREEKNSKFKTAFIQIVHAPLSVTYEHTYT